MDNGKSLYIDLLKKVLIDYHHLGYTEYKPYYRFSDSAVKMVNSIKRITNKEFNVKNLILCGINETSMETRLEGLDWPMYADSMIGIKRLDNLEFCVREIVKNKIEGDLIELGVWRGGATIFMRALLKDMNVTDKCVWVADSFEGLPVPDKSKYPADKDDKHHTFAALAISMEQVKHNFDKYGLLDDQVKFLKGWFKDTLPKAPIQKLSLLRLDGDMYESTMDGLVNLYSKLSVGGYIIVDDYGAVPGCKLAVEDYRKQHGITEEIIPVDWTGVYWKKEK